MAKRSLCVRLQPNWALIFWLPPSDLDRQGAWGTEGSNSPIAPGLFTMNIQTCPSTESTSNHSSVSLRSTRSSRHFSAIASIGWDTFCCISFCDSWKLALLCSAFRCSISWCTGSEHVFILHEVTFPSTALESWTTGRLQPTMAHYRWRWLCVEQNQWQLQASAVGHANVEQHGWLIVNPSVMVASTLKTSPPSVWYVCMHLFQ